MEWLLLLVGAGLLSGFALLARGQGRAHSASKRRSSDATRDQESSGTSPRKPNPARRRFRLTPDFKRQRVQQTEPVTTSKPPHAFSYRSARTGHYFDFTRDGNLERLIQWQLPVLREPEDIAEWLGISVNRLAWLSHRCRGGIAEGLQQSHYFYQWRTKKSGGVRLIEAPKTELRAVQRKILHELLDRVPTSAAAHGFVRGRSIRTHAKIHVKSAILVKFDLTDFYPSVTYGRVVAIFRAIGYCREAALWLARLTTTSIPHSLSAPSEDRFAAWRHRRRHLPQGAPTSPALANLSAYWLDQRLSGLARKFDARYSRYADDLAFSGDESLDTKLRLMIPLVQQVIHREKFESNYQKRQVLRRHQRQVVTGVVVNEKPNISRRDVDRLKAILTNCVQHGPASQNRDDHPNFAAHLAGRIAHVAQFHRPRAEKLRAIYARIDWTR